MHQRPGRQRRIHISRSRKLHRLPHRLRQHQLRLHRRPQPRPLQRFFCQPSIRRMLRVRHRNSLYLRPRQVFQPLHRPGFGPQRQPPHRIHLNRRRVTLPGLHNLLYKIFISRKKQVKRRPLLNLPRQLARGAHRNTNGKLLTLKDLLGNLRHRRSQVARRGHQNLLRG